MRRSKSLRALRRDAPHGVSVHVVKMPIMAYWTLTLDEEWQCYCAELEKNDREVLSQSEAPDEHGDIVCTRTTRMTARENPIPKYVTKDRSGDLTHPFPMCSPPCASHSGLPFARLCQVDPCNHRRWQHTLVRHHGEMVEASVR
jgi:hypothetical protein